MASVGQLPSGRWRVKVRLKNLAMTSKTFDTEAEATAWGESREAEILTAHNQSIPRVSAGVTFRDVVARYFMSPKFMEKAKNTQSRERSCSVRVLEYFGNFALAAINGALVQDYLDVRTTEKVRHRNGHVLGKKVSPDTVRLEKAFLGSVFKFAKRRDIVPSNIMKDTFELPKCKPREGRISLQQQIALYTAAEHLAHSKGANPCLRPWLNFVFETGTRPGEAAKIELSWVNLAQRKVSIPRASHKKRHPRVVLISDELAALLYECVDRAKEAGSKYLFFSRANARRQLDVNGKPLRRRRSTKETAARECIPYAYYHAWRNLCRNANVPTTINPHIIRHEFISRLFEETDLNDSQIASLVGDVNVLSLEPYKHLRVEQLRERQDHHLDELRRARQALEEKSKANLDAFIARARASRAESRVEREAEGDFSTPLQRIHAALEAERALGRIAAKDDGE